MNADRVFARAVADSGAPAWFARFAPDISKPGKAGLSLIHGSSAVTENDRAIFADASELLTWDPTDATVYNDRASGVTVGRYAVVRRSARADTLAHGHYLTQWRRQPDGSWKIQLDVGWVDK